MFTRVGETLSPNLGPVSRWGRKTRQTKATNEMLEGQQKRKRKRNEKKEDSERKGQEKTNTNEGKGEICQSK